MPPDSLPIPDFRVIELLKHDPAAERAALLAGLRAMSASIMPKYFYDALGCALYAAICELPEYYPTRTERAIFDANRAEIVGAIGTRRHFVDLGAGDGAKAERWLPHIDAMRYIAVDIAKEEMRKTLSRMAARFPGVEMLGIAADFADGLDFGGEIADAPVTFFYPGSSIGNFRPDEAATMLAEIRRNCVGPGSGLLIGADTKKSTRRLEAAYDDVLGVTAAFNRNALNHVNHVIGSDFVPENWAHRAFYNDAAGRIEMHLVATAPQRVMLDGSAREFAAGERIHTENSYKYAADEFAGLIARAGFRNIRRWQDPAGDFAVFYAS